MNNFRDLDIKISYHSLGEDALASNFLVPALKCARTYKRSVGYFSSGVIDEVVDGIVAMHRNGGKIQLIASPYLNQDDIKAIDLGYRKREEIIKDSFSKSFIDELYKIKEERLRLLVDLIAKETLDIKIIVTADTNGDYHDKFGILEDFDGNTVVFYGSPNSSINGYRNNYEKIRIVKSWDLSNLESVQDEIEEFDSLWNGTNELVDVYDYKDSAKENILKVIEDKNNSHNKKEPIVLRDYQNEAIAAWIKNGYRGFYVMATGTGKTWTAIYSAKEVLKHNKAIVVICAPYKHLIKQWQEDVRKCFPDSHIILVSSENPKWEQQISYEMINRKYNNDDQLIIISTISSFNMDRFTNAMSKSQDEKILIVDEAHRFSNRSEAIHNDYKYILGLSATPYSGNSTAAGKELMDFFGGLVYSLPIEKALGKYLVNYYYHPIYVYATEEEESLFRYYTQKMMSCFKNDVLYDYESFVRFRRSRLRVISMASEKNEKIEDFVRKVKVKDHFVVYCGDGRLFDDDLGEEIRHIDSIKKKLRTLGIRASQFTAKETMKERMDLIDSFNRGDISSLVAIRCLDEGINIPSILSALILSSNDDYREFVQRRGRILRKYEGSFVKKDADIYDLIVLPSSECPAWAKIELRRFYEYARLSLNWQDADNLEGDLNEKLSDYGLELSDINVFEYDEVEDPLDE